MADARPFRALRFGARRVDPALTIAPPYDVISVGEQRALYERSPYNIVRVEYGEERAGDGERDNRYTRAARALDAWRREGVLVRDDAPAIYRYRQEFVWAGARHAREAYFAAVRLEPWERGVIKPHEHTLATPKADRLHLLRATRTQVSPVYSLYRPTAGAHMRALCDGQGEALADFEADGQRHAISAVRDATALAAFQEHIAMCDVYIADGHHRYETALAYRDEVRARASAWTGEEPENFVLMALTDAHDPGLLVLPTHRIVHVGEITQAQIERVGRSFRMDDVSSAPLDEALAMLRAAGEETRYLALGLRPGAKHLLTLRDRAGAEALMPEDQPDAWKRLDVSVLQYGVLRAVFGIDDPALAAGGAVTYTQDASEAARAVETGEAAAAFLLNPTPVDQVLAVADAGARMPQKSTYFHPKLPTGLVMNVLER
ncbi:MAG: DUF1015 domain-containing protein [Chloroflexota bacterium]|nr:DUF1015 domain-containing protein [Chloroflexota bacterium]